MGIPMNMQQQMGTVGQRMGIPGLQPTPDLMTGGPMRQQIIGKFSLQRINKKQELVKKYYILITFQNLSKIDYMYPKIGLSF
jgi:hypothetical protein